MTGKRNLFLGLLIGLALGGALSTFLSFHGWTSAQDSRTVLLRQGWNQLVWTADNQPADTALAAIAGNLVIAYGWQGESQTFTRYIPGRANVSTMGEVEKDSGYWLLMTREVAFSFPTADIQCPACPAPTRCPGPTPCPSCDQCTGELAECLAALNEERDVSRCVAACFGSLYTCLANAVDRPFMENCVEGSFSCLGICTGTLPGD